MPIITLPDGSTREFDQPVTVLEVARSISPRLETATLAAKIDGVLKDANLTIASDCQIELVTDKSEEVALEIVRHSTAHVLAQAVKQCFPSAQVTIGPVIDDGFYYDISYERPFGPEDLEKIEKVMAAIVKEDLAVNREEWSREEAIKYFESIGEHYKVEIIKDLPADETLSVYRQGDFIDLCRGPHVPTTSRLGVFKLMKVAGAYWRGDSNNEMLQRIYGTAWLKEKALKQYLTRLEEAEKRDHRKIGKALNFYHIEQSTPGMVYWHDRGWQIFRLVESYVRKVIAANGYHEIRTPMMADQSLWEKSGHWGKFREQMFVTESEGREYAVKPMNCPCHVQVFKQGLKSYRDLPLRLAEFGGCHRNEPSGSLHGLMRLRHFTQDDAHIFCERDTLQSEVAAFIDLVFAVYKDFGFEEISIKLSTRPEMRVGSDEIWDESEAALATALKEANLDYELQPGEGAFYGPKIEFSLRDCLGRVWQCGTMQVDFSMPDRLGATYVDASGEKQVPVMLHRAILGSLERFIGILIENTAGILPTWLAPEQVVIMPIADKHAESVKKAADLLKSKGIRVKTDLRNEKIGFRIRENTLLRIPYLVVIGDREAESGELAVRSLDGKNLGNFTSEKLYELIQNDAPSVMR